MLNTGIEKMRRLSYMSYIKENYVTIGVAITLIYAIKPLRELHIAYISTDLWVHQDAHCLSNSLAIVYIVITIKIEDVGSICENCRHSHLYKAIRGSISPAPT